MAYPLYYMADCYIEDDFIRTILFADKTCFDDFTRCADYELLNVHIIGKLYGKTYADKKEYVRQCAKMFRRATSEGAIYRADLDNMRTWFYHMGKRYGLTTIFMQNDLI